jgi:Arm DNA-binding domain
MLSDAVIHALRAGPKPRQVCDEKGLYLSVRPGGGRLWRYKYRFPPRSPGNKEKSLSLGSYPEISLHQARERRDEARRDLANGLNPSLRRTCQKICLGNTFESVVREFFKVLRAANIPVDTPSRAAGDLVQLALKSPHGCQSRVRRREPISSETVDTMERRLEMHVFPHIEARDIQLLRAPELLEVLRHIESRGTLDLAHRVRSIWRPVVFRTMEWGHLQVHGASPEWRVPWRRMKKRQPHIVPLSRQAAETLREVHLHMNLDHIAWRSDCCGLFHTPIAA